MKTSLAQFVLELECFRQKLYSKSKHTIYVQLLFFFENCAVYEIMRKKNNVETDWPQMAI